jgi:hypothetical protein
MFLKLKSVIQTIVESGMAHTKADQNGTMCVRSDRHPESAHYFEGAQQHACPPPGGSSSATTVEFITNQTEIIPIMLNALLFT